MYQHARAIGDNSRRAMLQQQHSIGDNSRRAMLQQQHSIDPQVDSTACEAGGIGKSRRTFRAMRQLVHSILLASR